MAIETEVEILKNVVSKLDSSIEKISQVSNDIGRLLAVHDERIGQLERVNERRSDDVRDLYNKIGEQTKEIVNKLDKIENTFNVKLSEHVKELNTKNEDIKRDLDKIDGRLDVLEKWKWYALGAAAVLGFIIGNLNDIIHLIK